MVREILLLYNLASNTEAKYERLPEIGSTETTKSPTPYKLKSGIKAVYLTFFEKDIDLYLWDMPGLGGKNPQ